MLLWCTGIPILRQDDTTNCILYRLWQTVNRYHATLIKCSRKNRDTTSGVNFYNMDSMLHIWYWTLLFQLFINTECNYTKTVYVRFLWSTVYSLHNIRLETAVLCYNSEGRRFELVSLEFFIDVKSFRSHYGPGVDSVSNRNEYQE